MQVLMSEDAFGRVRDRLDTDGLDILTMDGEGHVTRGGQPVSDPDPEVFWLSLDLYPDGPVQPMFRAILAASNGRWAQGFSAGLDSPAFRYVMEKGVRLTKSSAQAPAIAEYVLAHAFSLIHPIAEQAAAQAAHDWRKIRFREIGSTRWLMVGYGAIGREIARRLAPFGARLTVVRRHAGEPEEGVAEVRTQADLPKLLPDADVVVLACALNDETRGLADAAFFGAMRPDSLFINIGRGGLVDEDALKAGLEARRPAHAVLDVFQTEPLPKDAWFWDHPAVRVTAHDSALGDGLLARGDAQFLENLRRYRAGEPLLNEADKAEVGL